MIIQCSSIKSIFLVLCFYAICSASGAALTITSPIDEEGMERHNDVADYWKKSDIQAIGLMDGGQRDSLEETAKVAYESAASEGTAEHKLAAANQLASIYELRGDFQTALKYHKAAREAEAALHLDARNKGEINVERLKAEYTAKQAEALASQQAESRKSTLMIIGIFSLAVISKTLLLYIIIRRKRTHNKELRILLDQVERQNIQLDEGYRFKQHLISVVAHDLRTPVSSIVSLLRMFEDGYLSEGETRTMLQRAHREMDTLKQFLEELLNWIVSQPEGLRSKKENFDLVRVMHDTIDLHRLSAEEKGIEVIVDIPETALVHADRQMIKIIMTNLLSNAVKFSDSADQVFVGISATTDRIWEITIRDTGRGFPVEMDQQLAELPGQGMAGTRQEKSTGIGLSLCILYLQANNSVLHVQSLPGQGTTFSFSLNAAK